jgi:hypothetical protein
VALALAVSVALVCGLSFQSRFTGDGAGFAGLFVLEQDPYYNVAYLPLARGLRALCSFEESLGPLRALSVIGAGLSVGLAFLLVRCFGRTRTSALVTALLYATTPALAHFGTTIEVHTPAAAAVGLVGVVTWLAPWQRPRWALALVALLAPILFWTQQTSLLLLPGWVLLVQLARSRSVGPFGWRALVLGVAPALLASLLLALATANWLRFGDFGLTVESQMTQITQDRLAGDTLWSEWIRPLRFVLPVALLGAWRLRRERSELLTVALLCAPAVIFFSWWGIEERGGYFLTSGIFLLPLVAGAFERASPMAIVGGLTLAAVQGVFAAGEVRAYDQGWRVDERVALVREALDERGIFLSTVDQAPPIAVYAPGAEEFPVWRALTDIYLRSGNAMPEPDAVLELFMPQCDRWLKRHGQIVFETGYRNLSGRALDEQKRPWYELIEQALRERYRVRDVDHPYWSLLIVEPN